MHMHFVWLPKVTLNYIIPINQVTEKKAGFLAKNFNLNYINTIHTGKDQKYFI